MAKRRDKKDGCVSDGMTLLQCLSLVEKMDSEMQALIDHDVEFAKAEIIKRDLGHLAESLRDLVNRV